MNLVPEALKRPGQVTVLVCGGRYYDDVNTLCDYLDHKLVECEEESLDMRVAQTGGPGAEAIAREWAALNKEAGSNVELVTGKIDDLLKEADVDYCLCTEDEVEIVARCEDAGLPVVRAA